MEKSKNKGMEVIMDLGYSTQSRPAHVQEEINSLTAGEALSYCPRTMGNHS